MDNKHTFRKASAHSIVLTSERSGCPRCCLQGPAKGSNVTWNGHAFTAKTAWGCRLQHNEDLSLYHCSKTCCKMLQVAPKTIMVVLWQHVERANRNEASIFHTHHQDPWVTLGTGKNNSITIIYNCNNNNNGNTQERFDWSRHVCKRSCLNSFAIMISAHCHYFDAGPQCVRKSNTYILYI